MKKRSLLIISVIFLVIVGPMIFAWYLSKNAHQFQLKQSNHGQLITSLPSVKQVNYYDFKRRDHQSGQTLLSKWWLVYVGPEKCYQECQEDLYNLRQLQVALGKDAVRVDRMFVAHPNCPSAFCETYLTEHYPEMKRISMEPKDFNYLFLQSSISSTIQSLGQIYIIDPLGNVMMVYSPESEPKAILSDLKRLLRVSKVG